MATKTAAKAPAKPKVTKTPAKGASAASDAWDTAMASIESDFAKSPEAMQKFMSQRVGAPADRSSPVTAADRAVPEGLETDDLTAQKGNGYGVRFPRSGVSTTIAGGASRQQSSRIIILAMGVAGAAIIIGGQSIPAYKVGNTKVPGNMRAFAGVIVAGTVALVINEVSPSLGMLFGVSLIFVAVADVKAFTSFGDAVFGRADHIPPGPPGPHGPQNLPNGKANPNYIPPPGAPGSPQNPIQVGP